MISYKMSTFFLKIYQYKVPKYFKAMDEFHEFDCQF